MELIDVNKFRFRIFIKFCPRAFCFDCGLVTEFSVVPIVILISSSYFCWVNTNIFLIEWNFYSIESQNNSWLYVICLLLYFLLQICLFSLAVKSIFRARYQDFILSFFLTKR